MNLNDLQNNLTTQASDFAKVFTAHASKIANAQQAWLQGQSEALKSQFEQAVATKDLAASATQFQTNLQPAAQNLVKHAQELYALTLAAQKELTAKTQDQYKAFAEQANTAVEATIKQLPNQGEPLVSLAKSATQAFNGAFEQVAEQLKTAQTNYEAQVAKVFEQASTGFAAPAVAKTSKK